MSHIKPKVTKELSDIVVAPDTKVKLKNYYPDAKKYPSLSKYIEKYSKKELEKAALAMLENSREQLIETSDKLWASKKYAVLMVLQGMDTSGKDGIISHVLSGLNPQGCTVASFKVPSSEENSHDFLWRHSKKLPARGEIVIFNRSHYESVLVTKVHPEVIEQLPAELSLAQNKNFWEDRYKDINAWEKHLARNGVVIIKFFLYISKDEQKARLLERLTNEDKHWKASTADLKEREYWDEYIAAYEDAISKTSTEHAPWIIVPANDKKIARAIVGISIASVIDSLEIEYPTVDASTKEFLMKAKSQLESEE